MNTFICNACGYTQNAPGACPNDGTTLMPSPVAAADPAPAAPANFPPPAPTTPASFPPPAPMQQMPPAAPPSAPFGAPPAPPSIAPTTPLPAIPPDFASVPASQAVEAGGGFQIPVRPKLKPFLSSHPSQEPVLVARSWAGQTLAPKDRKLSRKRQIAEGLPDWNPMPPGELTITRPATHGPGRAA